MRALVVALVVATSAGFPKYYDAPRPDAAPNPFDAPRQTGPAAAAGNPVVYGAGTHAERVALRRRAWKDNRTRTHDARAQTHAESSTCYAKDAQFLERGADALVVALGRLVHGLLLAPHGALAARRGAGLVAEAARDHLRAGGRQVGLRGGRLMSCRARGGARGAGGAVAGSVVCWVWAPRAATAARRRRAGPPPAAARRRRRGDQSVVRACCRRRACRHARDAHVLPRTVNGTVPRTVNGTGQSSGTRPRVPRLFHMYFLTWVNGLCIVPF